MDKKQFAIDHMNKDHVLALYDYVNAYAGAGLDFWEQPTNQLRLTDVALDKLFLEWKSGSATKTAEIPIDPPMSSFDDLRPTVVAMAHDAAKKLRLAAYQVKTYKHWDQPLDFIIDVLFWILILIAVNQPDLAQYHPALGLVEAHAGKLALATVACHLAEIYLVMIPLLKKYRVPAPAYWKWLVAPVSGGYFSIQRFHRTSKHK